MIKSGQRLTADATAEIRLKPGTNTCMVRNEHVVGFPDRPVPAETQPDRDIHIEGGIWTTLAVSPGESNGNLRGASSKQNPVVGTHGVILLQNVRRVLVKNVTIRQSRAFAIHLGNARDFIVDGVTLDRHGRDGVHVDGPASDGLIRRVSGDSHDDPVSLTAWDCVDWTTRRLRIISPKTDRGGRPSRIAPILPEVWPFLEALRSISPNDEGYVFHRLRQRESVRATERGFWGGVNLRTELLKKLGRQGLEPWPKLWHALRASAETDPVSKFPVHVVATWLGNSPAVAAKHYLVVTDADFERASFGRTPQTALQSALQSPVERDGTDQSTVPENAETP